ncbi:Maf family protein [Agarivorans sp. MS3-6]|uniref:Maf family protein n=1 Tax=Agarivorans sp. TSD2052 TaxID=2937286 RepID=UPI00200F1AF6|nr:Maf family protein [Agarivorans sp. TSD2052]UPW17990.1 Maf family nucleotide pyrophosphatase [Agarivorans sp. TSD2052]
MRQSHRLVLASASPRRQELLTQLGWEFSVAAADIDETPQTGEPAQHLVCRLAEQKAYAVYQQQKEKSAVLGSDTIVVCQGKILGKPVDQLDSLKMLSLLSSKQHQVMTAICLYVDGKADTQLITTEVFFRQLSESEMRDYWLSQEPIDKAGSYAIQGIGGKFVERIEGSYSSVVGLPLVETDRLLNCYLTR